MNIPPFWAKGSHGPFSVWRFSFINIDEARQSADAAARGLVERFPEGQFEGLDRYGYGDRAMREQVLRKFEDPPREVAAAVTRNSYGSLVLITEQLLFVDVDLPATKTSGVWKKLFGGGKEKPGSSPETEAVTRAGEWVQRNAGWGWRIYRTFAGLRLMATHALISSSSPVCDSVFEAMQADPLYRYRRLCKSQKCFRARLTPKPWRCGIDAKPARWPWVDAKHEKQFLQWDKKYLSACAEKATTRLIVVQGNSTVHPKLQPLMQFHDDATRAASDLPLA